ncbi:Cell wall-associated hydrolase, NlpC family [Evansella caseinilytica]|uniref:Cell wall-associated hydrolase, NlpC family n=1 Tax=Evansella caseinilytica TaxID=1503961 RepID=A0A1H3THD2_9BACI|nr:NlpC/P60 family protein [Evansella caseinilytica]SDZ49278.1 Cell wall-associated hydrolase, NlpC family [Evansella caseinilytica]
MNRHSFSFYFILSLTSIIIIGGFFTANQFQSVSKPDGERPDQPVSVHTQLYYPAASSDNRIKDLDQLAKDLLGVPYNQQGTSPEEGFSTASLVQYLYLKADGTLLPRKTVYQQELGAPVALKDLKKGDLLFFQNDQAIMSGIYLENNHFITATKSGVAIRNLQKDGYWKMRFIEARRLSALEKAKLSPETYADHENPVIREAMTLLHRPYLLTGNTLAAFDCSFLVQHVFEENGIFLPRITHQQFQLGEDIPLSKAKPGDVVYFSGTWQEGISHTGIYLGDHFFIHASGEEGKTTISYLGEQWLNYFTGVKRFDQLKLTEDHPAVSNANELLNIEYTKGGAAPEEGFDYSGLVYYLFQPYDKAFPRSSAEQWNYGMTVEHGNEKPGDVYFFQASGGNLLPAVYIGNEQIIVVRKDEGVSTIQLPFSQYWTYERLAGIKRYSVRAFSTNAD